MYKIVPITSLTTADEFISSDKIIQISNDRTKMFIGENDYEHKNKFYLSSCIDNADRSLNAYLSAYDNLSNTYITSALSDVYIESGNLITKDTIDKILSSDAFLTKEGCKSFEAECVAYINELKNKAVSIIMAKLNESFIKQNSVKRPVYGQISSSGEGDNASVTPFVYTSKLLVEEDYQDYVGDAPSGQYKFNFKSGEFTLAKLLFFNKPNSSITGVMDSYIFNYTPGARSYFMNEEFTSVDDIIRKINTGFGQSNTGAIPCVFNATNKSDFDLKIKVPATSFDFAKKQSIPMARLIAYILKNQIYTVITNICNNYASLMVSVPKLGRTFEPGGD